MKLDLTQKALLKKHLTKQLDMPSTWLADVTYYQGARVRHAGKNWIAAGTTQGVEPGTSGDWGEEQ
jgi:chitodextrinase